MGILFTLVVLFSFFLVSGLAAIQCYAGSQSLSLKNVHKASLAFSASWAASERPKKWRFSLFCTSLDRGFDPLSFPFSSDLFIPCFPWDAGMAQWWEHWPPTNVVWVRFPLLCTKRFFPDVPVSPHLKNQHLNWLDLCWLLISVCSVPN